SLSVSRTGTPPVRITRWPMLSKCANPLCSMPFQYLRDGKVFQIELDESGLLYPPGPSTRKSARTERFWLCGPCSVRFTLAFDRGKGIEVRPLRAVSSAA